MTFLCRPKYTIYPSKPNFDQPKFDPSTTGLKYGGMPPYAYYLGPSAKENPPQYAYLDVPQYIKNNALMERLSPHDEFYCNPLSPLTRVLLENLTAGVNDSYTNAAGSTNVGAGVPITQTSGNTFQVGIGYAQKPILRQLRAFWHSDVVPAEVAEQGTPFEDFIYNAVFLNAGISYGKTLNVKQGGGTPASSVIETLNTRPTYFVGLTYSIDLERAWIHIMHPYSRAADAGYYYKPPCDQFFYGYPCSSN